MKYHSKDFLCTLQEPGANASEIFAVLKHVRPGDGFSPNFDMFAKSDVSLSFFFEISKLNLFYR